MIYPRWFFQIFYQNEVLPLSHDLQMRFLSYAMFSIDKFKSEFDLDGIK